MPERGVLRISQSPMDVPITGKAQPRCRFTVQHVQHQPMRSHHLITCTAVSRVKTDFDPSGPGIHRRNVHSDPLSLTRRGASAQCSWHDIFNRRRFKGCGFTANDSVRDHQTKRLILLIGYPPDANMERRALASMRKLKIFQVHLDCDFAPGIHKASTAHLSSCLVDWRKSNYL